MQQQILITPRQAEIIKKLKVEYDLAARRCDDVVMGIIAGFIPGDHTVLSVDVNTRIVVVEVPDIAPDPQPE